MKIFFYALMLISLPVMILSCGSDNAGDELSEEDLYNFTGLSLKPYGIPVIVMLPNENANIGASTKPEVTHVEGDFKWEIEVGPNFHLNIDDWGANRGLVKDEKKALADKDFYKIKYIIDEPDLIMYERILKVDGRQGVSKNVGFEHKTYHVFGQVIVDDIAYVFQSREDGYEKMIIDLMVKSIKSIKPLEEK